MHAFLQVEHHNLLAGVVHVDDGYLGGKRQGIRAHGSGRTPFITALSLVNEVDPATEAQHCTQLY